MENGGLMPPFRFLIRSAAFVPNGYSTTTGCLSSASTRTSSLPSLIDK